MAFQSGDKIESGTGTTGDNNQHIQNKNKKNDQSMTYAEAGVSISTGNNIVNRIKSIVSQTAQAGASAILGGFGGTFDLSAAGFEGAPTLVAGMDGIGTKVLIASETGIVNTVGIDLVAMNVNDLIVQGAKPLFFLDYYASSHLVEDEVIEFVKGVVEGCKIAKITLVGGETAEMPGSFSNGKFEASGCAVGAIAFGSKMLPIKEQMREGDVLLGLASSGLHSNGYSLVRSILKRKGLDLNDPAPWAVATGDAASVDCTYTALDGRGCQSDSAETVGKSLLTPTKIYVQSVLAAIEKGLFKGLAHITGGGLVENVPRILPDHLHAQIDPHSYPVPSAMQWLKNAGNVDDVEFATVWNTGIGMVAVVDHDRVHEALDLLTDAGEQVYQIGQLISSEQRPGQPHDRCLMQGGWRW